MKYLLLIIFTFSTSVTANDTQFPYKDIRWINFNLDVHTKVNKPKHDELIRRYFDDIIKTHQELKDKDLHKGNYRFYFPLIEEMHNTD